MKSLSLGTTVRRAIAVGVVAAVFAASAPAPVAAAAAPPTTVTAVAGTGFWDTLGCVACVAGFLVAGGTTLVGVAVVLAANPEIAVACTATCAQALN